MNFPVVLAATDFSTDADQALARAAQIAARQPDGRLEIVHVVDAFSLQGLKRLLAGQAGPIATRLLEDGSVALRRIARKLSDRFGVRTGSFVATGHPANQIAAYAEEIDASLVLLGARGSDTARQLLLGTTAARVLRRTQRPTLIVKTDNDQPYRRVLCATDFSAASAAALEIARGVAPEATMSLLHALELPLERKLAFAGVGEPAIARYRAEARRETETAAQAFNARLSIDLSCDIESGYAPQVIRDHARRLRPDLIAIGRHGRSPLETLLIGSVSEHVLADADCDVLVVGLRAARD